jgi:hypothetical protein
MFVRSHLITPNSDRILTSSIQAIALSLNYLRSPANLILETAIAQLQLKGDRVFFG